MNPQRIQLSRRPGFRMLKGAVKVDRSTRWGNPFVVGGPPSSALIRKWGWIIPHRFTAPCDCIQDAVSRFSACFVLNPTSADLVRSELAGQTLACWCKHPEPGEPDLCHAAVLLRIANGQHEH